MMGSMQNVNVGMSVVGSEGDTVGTVKEVRGTDFLVDRRMQRDVYVPLDAVQSVTADTVALNIPAAQVDDMNWPTP